MKTTTYLAITIGPIFKTLGLARKTRELWGASYLFSHMMCLMTKEFTNKLKDYCEIILPYDSETLQEEPDDTQRKAGLYPDRLLMRVKGENKKAINDNVQKIKKGFKIKEIIEEVFQKDAHITGDFDQFISHHIIIAELPETTNPISHIWPLLDALEQKSSYIAEYEDGKHPVIQFIKNLNKSDIFKKVFDSSYYFPMIRDIAIGEIEDEENTIPKIQEFRNDEKVDDNQFYKYLDSLDLEEKKIKLFQYHRYFTVIHADGDNMGSLIEALFTMRGAEGIKELSALLFHFGREAQNIIENHKGLPIYLGGDDLLFFAPFKTRQGYFLDLIAELDELFLKTVSHSETVTKAVAAWNHEADKTLGMKQIGIPGLTFGVSLSYSKYPMAEAIEASRHLMWRAKEHPGKHSVALRFLKHSGHAIETVVSKHSTSWQWIREFMKDTEASAEQINSIQYKLETLRPMLVRALTGIPFHAGEADWMEELHLHLPDETLREMKLENLAEHFFTDEEAGKGYVKDVLSILLQMYRDTEDRFGNRASSADAAIDMLYAVLRIKQFSKQSLSVEE